MGNGVSISKEIHLSAILTGSKGKIFNRVFFFCFVLFELKNIVKNIQRLPVDRHLIDRCEELFVTLPKKIHVNHAFLLQLRISLIHLYGNVPGFLIPELPVGLLQRKAQLCAELLEALRHLCPGYSRLRGFHSSFYFHNHRESKKSV